MCMWPMNFLPRVRTCCWCIPLRLGSMLIGVLWLLGSLLLIAYSTLELLKIFKVVDSDGYYKRHSDGEKWVTVAEYVIMDAISILLLISSLFLLLGACTDNMKKLRLWLIMNVVLFVVVLLCTVLRTSTEFFLVEADTHKITHFLKFLFFGIVINVIYFYCLLVVNSYYQNNS